MTVENPQFDTYHHLVKEAQDIAFLSSVDNRLVTGSTLPLASAILDAFEAGFDREAILTAIQEGEMRGALRMVDPRDQYQDDEYWEAVKAEIDAFWENRYDPDRKEDW